jgi:hypothetical protein
VRAVDVLVDGLDFDKLGFVGVQALDTGRPGYHPRTMLKLYIYGYLNRIPSSRRLERECQRNIEMIWLTRQLAPSRTSRLSRTSARTMAGPFARFVASSSRYALPFTAVSMLVTTHGVTGSPPSKMKQIVVLRSVNHVSEVRHFALPII